MDPHRERVTPSPQAPSPDGALDTPFSDPRARHTTACPVDPTLISALIGGSSPTIAQLESGKSPRVLNHAELQAMIDVTKPFSDHLLIRLFDAGSFPELRRCGITALRRWNQDVVPLDQAEDLLKRDRMTPYRPDGEEFLGLDLSRESLQLVLQHTARKCDEEKRRKAAIDSVTVGFPGNRELLGRCIASITDIKRRQISFNERKNTVTIWLRSPAIEALPPETRLRRDDDLLDPTKELPTNNPASRDELLRSGAESVRFELSEELVREGITMYNARASAIKGSWEFKMGEWLSALKKKLPFQRRY